MRLLLAWDPLLKSCQPLLWVRLLFPSLKFLWWRTRRPPSCQWRRGRYLRSRSSLLGSKDGVTPARDTHDDLLPPPSPSEPYEVFLARVGRATSHSAGPTMQPAAVALPSASVTTVTTGNHLPTPFPTYEVSSWMHQSQLQASRFRMPLPASFYTPLPSPGCGPDGVPP